jgi:hypothetical protein
MLLTQVFLSLPTTDPITVANAFFQAMYQFDCKTDIRNDYNIIDVHDDDQSVPQDCDGTTDSHSPDENSIDPSNLLDTLSPSQSTRNSFAQEFYHILQFCHLCYRRKIPPVLYTINNSIEVRAWLPSIYTNLGLTQSSKRFITDSSSAIDDDDSVHHTTKISWKDEHLINTMLKRHESVDNTTHRSNKEKEEKGPRFKRLEPHKKTLILIASALPPSNTQLDEPTDFYKSFLQKKTQFKAKELLVHCLNIDNVSFHPTTSFVDCLWNSNFTWLTPDLPSRISIFFCPELPSINSSDIEKDRNLALIDKVKPGDIEKLSKQKFSFPDSIMELVWLTQNFYAIISLCFGPASHSAKFLKDWANHITGDEMYAISDTNYIFFASCSSRQC